LRCRDRARRSHNDLGEGKSEVEQAHSSGSNGGGAAGSGGSAAASPARAIDYPSDYDKGVVYVQISKVAKGHKDDDHKGEHVKLRMHVATYGYVDDADVKGG
jgi:hypothetical protein